MDAQEALADLMEISSQVEAAVLLTPGGGVEASTMSAEEHARAFAAAALQLLDEAERVRGERLRQVQVTTETGSVFVVRDDGRVCAATTGPSPTVGLVFYDLKTCLRAVSAEADAPA